MEFEIKLPNISELFLLEIIIRENDSETIYKICNIFSSFLRRGVFGIT
jgi:hypothetical protein